MPKIPCWIVYGEIILVVTYNELSHSILSPCKWCVVSHIINEHIAVTLNLIVRHACGKGKNKKVMDLDLLSGLLESFESPFDTLRPSSFEGCLLPSVVFDAIWTQPKNIEGLYVNLQINVQLVINRILWKPL